MSIKTFGLTFAAAMSGLVVAMSGVQLKARWGEYYKASAAFAEESLLSSGFRAAGALAVERGPVNRAILGANAADPGVMKEFDADKRVSD